MITYPEVFFKQVFNIGTSLQSSEKFYDLKILENVNFLYSELNYTSPFFNRILKQRKDFLLKCIDQNSPTQNVRVCIFKIFFFIFPLRLAYNIISVTGVQHSNLHIYINYQEIISINLVPI